MHDALPDMPVLLNSDNLHSDARNSLGFLSSGVDPRTGHFQTGLSLPLPHSSDLAGPGFTLSVGYNYLSAANAGLGTGWAPSYTSLDADTGRLSLASGETYVRGVISSGGRREKGMTGRVMRFPDLKLPAFTLAEEQAEDGARYWLLTHRDGRRERLKNQGGLWLPHEQFSPDGRAISFVWQVQNRVARLLSIHEGPAPATGQQPGRTLLSASYTTSPSLTLHQADDRQVRVRLALQNQRVSAIHVESGDGSAWAGEASWQFGWKQTSLQKLWLIQEVRLPTGGKETVVWKEDALRVPPGLVLPDGTAVTHLPAVSRYVRSPGDGLADIISSYLYSGGLVGFGDHNCYGYGGVSRWTGGEDNLYLLPANQHAYRYGSVEYQEDGAKQRLRTITRHYNRFHLQLLERTDTAADGQADPQFTGCRTETVTDYHDNPALLWKDQPAYCQLPKTQTTRVAWLGADGTEMAAREAREQSWFDDEGNPLRQWQQVFLPVYAPDGGLLPPAQWTEAWQLTAREYYSPAGETAEDGTVLCPPDPAGMTRHLKQETVWPAGRLRPDDNGLPVTVPPDESTGQEGAPVLRTRYRHTLLPALPGCPSAGTLYACRETLYEVLQAGTAQETETEISREEEVRVNALHDDGTVRDPALLRHHGRPLTESTITGGKTTTTVHAWSLTGEDGAVRDARGDTPPALVDTLTVTGYDGTTFTHRSARSLLHGETIEEEDALGCVTRRTFDVLGRKVAETTAATDGTKHATVTWTWTQENGRWVQTTTDVSGQMAKVYLDGLGRSVREALTPPDGCSPEALTVSETVYDALGRPVRNTATHRGVNRLKDNSDTPVPGDLTLVTDTKYDGWGQSCAVTGPDGVTTRTQRDPVVMTEETWQEGQDAEERTVAGPRLRTQADAGGQPLVVWRLATRDSATVVYRQFTYDSAGRMLSETDGDGNRTGYAYDALDRVTCKTLPDGTTIHTDYDPAFTGGLATALTVKWTDTEGKAYTTLAGTRTYDGTGRLVSESCGGRTTRWEYEAGYTFPARTFHPDGRVTYGRYDAQMDEAPLSQSAVESSPEREWTYYPQTGLPESGRSPLGTLHWARRRDGQVLTETATHHDGAAHTVTYCWSDGDWLNEREESGIITVYAADSAGRPVWRRSGDDTVTRLAYDALGRLTREETTRDGQISEIRITFDGYGREACRTLTLSGGGSTLTQETILHWTPGDSLERRAETSADGVRTDTFRYDARGRLTEQVITADVPERLPVDEHGKAYTAQRFVCDGLDNLLSVTTAYLSAAEQPFVRTYNYTSDTDPFLLTRVSPGWQGPEDWVPDWDACGRLKADELGRLMTYGADGRLASAGGVTYACDALFRVSRLEDAGRVTRRWYRGAVMVAESDDAGETYLSHGALGGVTQTRVAGAVRTALLSGANAQGSVVAESRADGVAEVRYDAWGRDSGEPGQGRTGYAGMVREADGGYLPGSYRWYSPRLRRFSAPDSASPFGEGGINPYAYAGNNPVLRNDTDGHAWWNWALLAVGAVATVATLGSLAPMFAPVAVAGATAGLAGALSAGAAVMAGVTATQAAVMAGAVLGGVSLATGIASAVLNETGHQKEAGILGWVSLGTGVASLGLALAPAVTKGVTKAGQFVGKWRYRLQHAGGKSGKMGSSTGKLEIVSSVIGEAEYTYDTTLNVLTIYAHGRKFLSQSDKIKSGSKFASQVIETMNNFENMGRITPARINFICCHSAEGGMFSQAQILANKTGLRVVGFIGPVDPKGNMDLINNTPRSFSPMNSPVRKSLAEAGNKIFGKVALVDLYAARAVRRGRATINEVFNSDAGVL